MRVTNLSGFFKDRSYSEVAKSPKKTLTLPLKKGGLKLATVPDKGQVTLLASFAAGKLLEEAKKFRQQVLMKKKTVEVGPKYVFKGGKLFG